MITLTPPVSLQSRWKKLTDKPESHSHERKGPTTIRRGSRSEDATLSADQQRTVHEWELKHGVVPLDDAHPHSPVQERAHGEKSGPVAPRRGSMAESVPLSPTQAAVVHEWEHKHGIVTLDGGGARGGQMDID